MHFTLLVAGALLPGELAVALTSSLDTPTLTTRLSRARLVEHSVAAQAVGAHFGWLANKLFAQPVPAPTAPYAYAQLTGAAAPLFVWHADPVHMEAARDHLIVQSLDTDAPNPQESSAMIAVANELALNTGCQITSVAQRWFLLSEHEWQINTRPLAAVNETTVEMPDGRDAQVWNRLHNEIQMAWHAHEVNVQREASGLRTINALWLHGGGRWKPLPPIEFAQVQSDAAALQGAARAAGARSAPASAQLTDKTLVVLDDAWVSKQRQDWAAWLRAIAALDGMLVAHPDDAIDLIFCGDTCRTFEVRPSDRYKPWRRRTFAQAFAA